MHRDEDLLIEPWLRYYGYLFGFENIMVFDHGSVIPGVIETLQFYQNLGVEVRWDCKTPGDYHGKGQHFKNIIQHWDAQGGYDFAIPLDCDEFLAVFTENGLTCNRTIIHDHLEPLKGSERPLGFDLSLFNVPDQPGWFWAENYPKCFLASNTVDEIDFGNHAIRTRSGGSAVQTNFVYLHHHYKSLERTRQHARQKLDAFIDVDDMAALRDYDGPGLHLVKHFLMNEDEYLSQFDDKLLVQFRDLGLLLRGLGISGPLTEGAEAPSRDVLRLRPPIQGSKKTFMTFDSRSYVDGNLDLLSSGILPLKHYLLFGFKEGRRLKSDPA